MANRQDSRRREPSRQRRSPQEAKRRRAELRKAWRLLNRDKLRAQDKIWRDANRDMLNARSRAYTATHREQLNVLNTKWRKANLHLVLWYSAKYRAAKCKVPFTITPADIVIPKTCPIFGIKLVHGIGKGKKTTGRPNSPTLDRINPKKGYVHGNVAVISHRANRMKADATAKEHRRIAEWMDAR